MSKVETEVLGRLANIGYYLAVHRQNPRDVAESFRPNQIKCKTWLVEEIANFTPTWNKVLVVGSWNGLLLWELLREHCDIGWIDFLDSDPNCHSDRDAYFEINDIEKNYSNLIMNAEDFSDYAHYDLVINTSCEHMPDIPAVYGPLYAIQSNDYVRVEEHINCVNSAKELAKKNNITNVMYDGYLKTNDYTRYMAIGYYA